MIHAAFTKKATQFESLIVCRSQHVITSNHHIYSINSYTIMMLEITIDFHHQLTTSTFIQDCEISFISNKTLLCTDCNQYKRFINFYFTLEHNFSHKSSTYKKQIGNNNTSCTHLRIEKSSKTQTNIQSIIVYCYQYIIIPKQYIYIHKKFTIMTINIEYDHTFKSKRKAIKTPITQASNSSTLKICSLCNQYKQFLFHFFTVEHNFF